MPCRSILSFLNYLCSKGTKHCEIFDASTFATGFVDIRLTGPLADDERNHLLHYRLTRGNVGRLKEVQRDLLVSKLIEHYVTEGDEPHQKIHLALTTVGPLARRKHEKVVSLSTTTGRRKILAKAF